MEVSIFKGVWYLFEEAFELLFSLIGSMVFKKGISTGADNAMGGDINWIGVSFLIGIVAFIIFLISEELR